MAGGRRRPGPLFGMESAYSQEYNAFLGFPRICLACLARLIRPLSFFREEPCQFFRIRYCTVGMEFRGNRLGGRNSTQRPDSTKRYYSLSKWSRATARSPFTEMRTRFALRYAANYSQNGIRRQSSWRADSDTTSVLHFDCS